MKKILLSIFLVLPTLSIMTRQGYCTKKPVYFTETNQKNKLTRLKFWNYLKGLSNRDISKAGFRNWIETTKAKLGVPFRLHMANDIKNLTYRGSNIYDIVKKSDFWFYPIIVERNGTDRIVSLLKVTIYKGNYEINSICCGKTAEDLDKIVSIWSKSQGFELNILKIQRQTNIDFVIIENKNVSAENIKPTLVALPDVYARFKTMRPLYAYELDQIRPWLKTESRKKLTEEGLNPYDIEGIPTPKEKTKKTKKTKPKTKITPMKKISQGGKTKFSPKKTDSTATTDYSPYTDDIHAYDQSILEVMAEE